MPHVVVVPFGVSEEGEGLGIGLAGLVHGFVRMNGDHVALAQLLSKDSTKAVEAFVPPAAWKELARSGPDPGPLDLVVTGSFEPPEMGRGALSLLAFDPKTGDVHAKEEVAFSADDAGSAVAETLRVFCTKLDADLGAVDHLRELEWASLESVIRAERCIVPNPLKNGARDRFAALGHLERAVSEAPEARFPAARLATCAMEAAFSARSPQLRDAALRAVVRALGDAPRHIELLEAASAMELRFKKPGAAEARILSALEIAPDRGSLWALLCESRRTRDDRAGARFAIHSGIARGIEDPLLFTEQAVLMADAGENVQAVARFREVLRRWPFFPSAFKNLAQIALREGDSLTAQSLVDAALAGRMPLHPDVLRQAIELALRTEHAGVARASRIVALSKNLVAIVPQDPWVRLVLARALAESGEKTTAIATLAAIEELAPGSVIAAEAQRVRFQISEQRAALEVDAVLRAAYEATTAPDLETLASRARRLAAEHEVWTSSFALGVIERRREKWAQAEDAFAEAIRRAPGCAPAYVELSTVHLAQKKPEAALAAAERAIAIEPENPQHRALAEKIRSMPPPEPPTRFSSLLSWLKK